MRYSCHLSDMIESWKREIIQHYVRIPHGLTHTRRIMIVRRNLGFCTRKIEFRCNEHTTSVCRQSTCGEQHFTCRETDAKLFGVLVDKFSLSTRAGKSRESLCYSMACSTFRFFLFAQRSSDHTPWVYLCSSVSIRVSDTR